MSTDVVQVPYEDSESGEQVTGTLRFHNTSGTVSWQPAGWTDPDAHHFSADEVVAFAAAVILWRVMVRGGLPEGILEAIKGRNKGLLGDATLPEALIGEMKRHDFRRLDTSLCAECGCPQELHAGLDPDNDARIEGAGDHVLEAIDLLESPEQLRARFDALVEAGLEGEEPAGGFSFAGERCPDCSAGWLGMAEPTSVSPHDTVGPAVAAAWMRDVRRAEAGEDVRGLYGWGMRLCPRHRIYGRQRQT